MVFGKTKLELKVGVFVFLGLVILAIFVLMIGKYKTWSSGYRIKVVFDFVNGVKVGAPVRFAGMDVGEVKRIYLNFVPEEAKTKVAVVGWVRREVKIPKDSTVWVNTLGLLGEKYLEIIPGVDYAHCLTPQEELAGVDPIAMHEVMKLAKSIVENIDDAIVRLKNKEGTMGKLLYDDEMYKELRVIIKDMEDLVKDIKAHPWKLFFKK